jgi:hypothetical protein
VLSRISRHPPVVLTVTPSVLNSATPDAWANASAGSRDSFIHRCARAPSSWQTRSIVSSETAT